MFAHPLTNLQTPPTGIPGQTLFQAALTTLQPFNPDHLDEHLENALGSWAKGSAELAAAPNITAEEKYCIRQNILWRLYVTIETHGLGADIARTIYNRARTVIDETPVAARPLDLSFLEGDNLIRKTLEHLRQLAVFYQNLFPKGVVLDNNSFLPPSAGFRKTTVIEANLPQEQAEAQLQKFLADNHYVRAILLGDDPVAAAGAVPLDNRLNIPGGGIDPGRGLWVKSYTLLRPHISTWLGAVIPHDYAQVRCIFISPKGKPSSFLNKTTPLDPANISSEILDAADADELS